MFRGRASPEAALSFQQIDKKVLKYANTNIFVDFLDALPASQLSILVDKYLIFW